MDSRKHLKTIFYLVVIVILLFLAVFLSLFAVSEFLGLSIGFSTMFELTLLFFAEGLPILLALISSAVAVYLGAKSLIKRIHRGEKLSDIVFPKEAKCPKCGSIKLGFAPSGSTPSPDSGKRRWKVTCYDCGEKWEKEYT